MATCLLLNATWQVKRMSCNTVYDKKYYSKSEPVAEVCCWSQFFFSIVITLTFQLLIEQKTQFCASAWRTTRTEIWASPQEEITREWIYVVENGGANLSVVSDGQICAGLIRSWHARKSVDVILYRVFAHKVHPLIQSVFKGKINVCLIQNRCPICSCYVWPLVMSIDLRSVEFMHSFLFRPRTLPT